MQKQKLVNGDKLFRWIFAENDGVPGLVVDVFEDILVCQIQSAPLEVFWPVFRDCLEAAFSDATGAAPRTLVEKRNAPVRAKEGLPIVGQDAIRGEPVVEAQYFWNGLKWWMTPGHSQKTGAYLDQRSNHGRAVEWARRLGIRQALDVCSFEGGFGLHLLKAGLQVTAVDVSASALAGMRRNAELNAFNAQNLETVQRDAFEFLRDHHKSGMQAEMISLDPPPFARNKEQKDAALRGFYDLNLRAVLCLKPGGLLVSCSCSHAVQGTEMKRMFKKIARSTGRPLKVLEVLGPAPDHAAALHFPEGEYLSAWFVLT